MTKLPSFQFYPGDWLKDPELRSCSPAARAAWIDFVCYLFLGPTRYSFLQAHFSAAIRCASKLLHVRTDVIQELLDKRVCKQSTRRGILFSARLLRDEHDRRRAKIRQRLSRSHHSDVTAKSHPSSSSSSASANISPLTPLAAQEGNGARRGKGAGEPVSKKDEREARRQADAQAELERRRLRLQIMDLSYADLADIKLRLFGDASRDAHHQDRRVMRAVLEEHEKCRTAKV